MTHYLQLIGFFVIGSLVAEKASDDYMNAWKSALAPAVETCLEQKIPDSAFEAEVTWIPAELARTPVVEAFELRCAVNHERPSGIRQFELELTDNTSTRFSVQARLSARFLLPVLRNAVPRGAPITAVDITKEWVEVTSSSPDYITCPERLKGKIARRNLSSMMPVASNHVHNAYIVRAGDTLELIYSEHGIEIAMKVVARQNGAPGDVIRLQAEQTRRLYQGILTTDGNAKWVRTL